MSPPLRGTSLVLAVGVVAVALAVLPFKLFELDRYFVPKELALHAVALVLTVLVLARTRAVSVDTADMLFAGFLVWSLASALFATNHWLAQRALGLSVSSAVVFWAARRMGAAGWHRPILIAGAIASVLAAATGLAQAYGVETDYFSLNRAPGGTFGNRNFVAHFSAIGLPALVYATVTARGSVGAVIGSLAACAVAAVLVLSRSRAAWLALAVSSAILVIPLLASRKYWGTTPVRGRLVRLVVAALVGGALAIVLPNQLNWSSDSPYLDSAMGVVDYSSGSGRGRLAQWANSARMAMANPVLGVGPGNWPVHYTEFAPANDRSLTDDGMTANPWPSSDWVAFLSERGFVAAAALLGVFGALFFGAIRRWSDLESTDQVMAKLALIGTITATLVVSAFDAALLLAAPAFLAWSIIGAASGVGRAGRDVTMPRGAWRVALVATLLVVGASVARSTAQTVAIATVGTGGTRARWIGAVRWDPGSYRINQRVAELYAARGNCSNARVYARRAANRFPNAPAPKRTLRRCGAG